MGVNWSAPDVVEWMKTAGERQRKHYLTMGVALWDEYLEEHYGYLDAKIACSVYGPPEKESEDDITSLAGYTEDQRKTAQKIREAIEGASETPTIYMSVIYLTAKIFKKQFDVAVFRLWLKNSDQMRFVDTEGRLYDHFQDYLKNNKLPKCLYCYPSSGIYTCASGDNYKYDSSSEPVVSYGTSPACDITARVANLLDWTGTGTSLVSGSIGIAALFTPIGPAILTAAAIGGFSSGIYTAGRSVNSLVDRGTHGQSIAPNNRESIGCWLSIIGSAVGVGASAGAAAAARAAQAGSTMNVASRFVVTALNVGTVSVNGVGVIFGLDNLIEKGKKNQLNPLDVLQFSMSVFFFTHSAMNFRTASTIIRETQHDVLRTAKKSLPDSQSRKNFKEFSKINYKQGEKGPMHRNAGTIRQLNLIENREQFFGNLGVALTDIRSMEGNQHISFDKGMLQLNMELDIDPVTFSNMSAEHKSQVVKSTNDLMNGRINYEKFLVEVKNVKTSERLGFHTQRTEFKLTAAKAFGVSNIEDVIVGGKRLFECLRGVDIDRLSKIFADSSSNSDVVDVVFVEGVRVLAGVMGFSSPHQFASFMEFAYKYLKTMAEGKTARAEFATQLVNPESQQSKELQTSYIKYCTEMSALNEWMDPNFSRNATATYHYVKHNEHQGTVTTEQEYLHLARSLFGESEFQTSVQLSEIGNRISFTYLDSAGDLFEVVVETHVDGQSVQHIATVVYRGSHLNELSR